ncbi:MAG: sigma 54-interacting transcriptional regulator [Polyangiaceae bacterium]|nr:sigma 54-interacting transcriptional regulator [Polyangiaceae bacterium]
MGTPKLFLEIISGMDRGVRIHLDAPTRTIGRALENDLVVRDTAVSRHHAVVTRTETGKIRLEICPDKLPVVVEGRGRYRLDLKPGIELLIGTTTIAVRSLDDEHASISMTDGGATERYGAGVSPLHLAAFDALSEILDGVKDIRELTSRMQAWCIEYAMATNVQLETNRTTIAPVSKDENGMIRVAVPILHDSATLVFTCPSPTGEVPDSFRQTLVKVGRAFARALRDARRSSVLVDERGSSQTFLGSSPAARGILHQIAKVAASNATVLLTGETGVGKTFIAGLIHEQGPRAKEPLEIINCATVPETLFESEFFGHTRGAFTGAVAPQVGLFEAAGRGTVVLDEIGDLSLANQIKLLRVLDDRCFKRLGSTRTIRLEARVICATNRDLEAMMTAGKFRSDLYHRISFLPLLIPPLRERGDDVLLLAEQFLREDSAPMERHVEGFSKEALDVITRHPWPGNVRELRAVIGRALILGDGPRIEASDLKLANRPSSPSSVHATLPVKRASMDRPTIEAALAAAGGNADQAAERLGISRATLYRRLAESKKGDHP